MRTGPTLTMTIRVARRRSPSLNRRPTITRLSRSRRAGISGDQGNEANITTAARTRQPGVFPEGAIRVTTGVDLSRSGATKSSASGAALRAFTKNPEGEWVPKEDVTILGPFGPVKIRAGQPVDEEMQERLDELCK